MRSTLPSPALLTLLSCAVLSTPAWSQERQFRQLQLVDGRTIFAEVLATEGIGLRMMTPQGERMISFELLMDMVPIQQIEYEEQLPERLWYVSEVQDPVLDAMFAEIPNLVVSRPSVSKLNHAPLTEALEACAADIDCLRKAVGDGDPLWIVVATRAGEGPLTLRGGISGASQVRTKEAAYEPFPVWEAGHDILGIQAPNDVPQAMVGAFPAGTNTKTPVIRDVWTAAQVNNRSLIPLPGYVSLAQGDAGRFGMGLGIGLVGTGAAAAVSATQIKNKSGDVDIGAAVGIPVATYVVLSALLNNALGHASRRANGGAKVTVLPTGNGIYATF